MQHRKDRPQRSTALWRLVGFCLALAFASFLFPLSASAHAIPSLANGPTFRVNVGFDSRYRDGNWVPVQVALRNDGPDFTGKVSIDVPAPYAGAGNSAPLSTYQEAISLPSGSQKEITLYVPFYFGTQGVTQTITVDLLNSAGQKVSTQASALRTIGPNDIFIGVLSDQASTGFGPLNALSLPNQAASVIVEPLNAASMPTIAESLNNFDLIVLDNFTTSTLSKEQLAALQTWVNQGGSLVVVGGPEWRNTLSMLPASLVPVNVTGTTTIPAGTHLLPVGGPLESGPNQSKHADGAPAPVTVSTAVPLAGSSVILGPTTDPLMVQAPDGQGLVCYLAFDPTLQPIVGWSQATTMWKGLLLRTLGDQLLSNNMNVGSQPSWKLASINGSGMQDLLQSLFPSAFPATWLILVLLLSYVAVLGPVRLLIVRWLHNRDWSWRIVLSTIVVFSLLSYGFALQEKGTSIISSSISVIQLNRPDSSGSMAHITTYVGVFVPSQGDFQVHIPGYSLVQPSQGQSRFYQGQSTPQYTTITSAQNGIDVNLQGVDIWTLRALVSQRDRQEHGGIVSHLTLQGNELTGTVSNTLPYALSDVYVLMSDHYVPLGHLAVGQTRQVNLSLADTPASSQGMSLADQIASSYRLPIPYSPFSNGNQPQNEVQRHMAMLATLSGESSYYYCGNGPCFQPVSRIVSSNGVVVTSSGALYGGNNPYLVNGSDPLLIPGSAATLIGWADRLPDVDSNVTINGSDATRVQEAIVQAPLDVGFSGSVTLPSDLVTSQVVDVQSQGANVQTQFPGIYSMTTGSMTFEFTLPTVPNLHATNLTIEEPTNLPQMVSLSGPSGPPVDANHLHASLYNWRTGSWDPSNLQGFSFATNNTQDYISPSGRVLMQFSNQDPTLGTAVFSKPSLEVQGTISSN